MATTTLLSSGNMLVRDVQEDANFSCIRALRQAKERTFIVKVSEPPGESDTYGIYTLYMCNDWYGGVHSMSRTV